MNIKRRTINHVYINVAPLVEVMLVLVIIFMITTPTMQTSSNANGIQVNLPKTKSSSSNDTSDIPIIVSINSQGQLYLDEKLIGLKELTKTLQSNQHNNVIYIRGDKSLSYGKIIEIMDTISSIGDYKVSLISENE